MPSPTSAWGSGNTSSIALLGQDRPARGDPPDQRARKPGWARSRRSGPSPPRCQRSRRGDINRPKARGPAQVAFALQRAKLVGDARGGCQARSVADLPDARRIATPCDGVANRVQDRALWAINLPLRHGRAAGRRRRTPEGAASWERHPPALSAVLTLARSATNLKHLFERHAAPGCFCRTPVVNSSVTFDRKHVRHERMPMPALHVESIEESRSRQRPSVPASASPTVLRPRRTAAVASLPFRAIGDTAGGGLRGAPVRVAVAPRGEAETDSDSPGEVGQWLALAVGMALAGASVAQSSARRHRRPTGRRHRRSSSVSATRCELDSRRVSPPTETRAWWCQSSSNAMT